MQFRASFHNTLGGGLRMGLQVLTIPLLMRVIGAEQYGLWVLVSAVVQMLTLLEGGLTVATTVFAARDLGHKDSPALSETLTISAGTMLGLASSAGVLLWLGAGFAVSLFSNLDPAQRAAATQALQWSALVVWMRLVQQIFVGIEQAFQRFGWMNIITTVQQALTNLGMLGLAVFGGRVVVFMQWHAVVGCGILCAHALVVWRLLRHLGLRPRWNGAKGREIGRFSLLIWGCSLGSVLFSQCDRLVVGRLLGAELLGIYGAITGVTVQINSLSALVAQPLVPLISQARARRQIDASALGQVRHAFELNAIIALGLGVGLIALAPLFLKVFFPVVVAHHYTGVFQIAVASYALYSLNGTGYNLLQGLQAAKECMLIQIIVGGVTLALISLGAWLGGLRGAVLGTVGYQGVWLLTVLGMHRLQLPAREWLHLLQPYMAWFAAVVLLTLWLPPALGWQFALTLAALLGMGSAFLLRHGRQLLP
jgi:O-antigen/teichoic acid export membrane protein